MNIHRVEMWDGWVKRRFSMNGQCVEGTLYIITLSQSGTFVSSGDGFWGASDTALTELAVTADILTASWRNSSIEGKKVSMKY